MLNKKLLPASLAAALVAGTGFATPALADLSANVGFLLPGLQIQLEQVCISTDN